MPTTIVPLSPTKPLAVLTGGFALVEVDASDHRVTPRAVAVKTHHILLFDCSGSMSGQLPLIRKDAKNKITTLVKAGDLVSIGYFSGTGQYGILLETVPVRDLTDHSIVYQAIDRLHPMGLTAFVGPLQKVSQLVDEAKAQNPEHAHTLFFLTDGHDNQARSEDEILAPCRALSQKLAKSVVVESGFYCNRPLLLKMTEALGGVHVFSEDFPSYQHAFEQNFSGTVSAAKKRVVLSVDQLRCPFVYALEDSGADVQVLTFAVDEQGEAFIPDHIQTVYALLKDASGPMTTGRPGVALQRVLLAALLLMTQRVETDMAISILRTLGDVALIKQFMNAFGKQALSDFQATVEGHLATGMLYAEGYDPGAMPPDDAFCLLDLIDLLMNDPTARFYPRHEAWTYRRISAKTGFGLTDEDKQALDEAHAQLLQAMSPDEARAAVTAISVLIGKRTPLSYRHAEVNPGIPFTSLTWNENRPNLSVLATFRIDIDLPANPYGLTTLPSKIYRNYSLIADGIVNVKKLPVSFSKATYDAIAAKIPVPMPAWSADHIFTLDLFALPVINRKRATQVSAKAMAEATWKLFEAKAQVKAAKHLLEEREGKAKSDALATLYSQAAADWLADLGITDSGYSPKTVSQKTGEEIQALELLVKIPGFSSLPSINAVLKKAGKKLNAAEQMIADALDDITRRMLLDVPAQPEQQAVWLKTQMEHYKGLERMASSAVAQMKMALLLSQGWFTEFSSLDEKELTVCLDGEDTAVTFESRTVTVKI